MNPVPNPLAEALIFYRDLGVDVLALPNDALLTPPEERGTAAEDLSRPGTVEERVSTPLAMPERVPLAHRKDPVTTGDSLEAIAHEVSSCQNCGLFRTRNRTVPGEGSPHPRILFVGEGPGEEEDLQGRPFVGAAGQLLDRIIEKMGLSREEVYIANVVKCRPPGNRDPQAEEVAACMPFLRRQIALLQPRVLVAMGRVAATWLLGGEQRITRIRGKVFDFGGIPLLPTYHPSYILRQQGRDAVSKVKWEVWNDMQRALELSREPVEG